MVTELVQLEQSETDKFGRRYTPEERAAWYLYWRTVAGRSCRKVALKFGVDPRTILAERDSGNWPATADQEDHDDFSSSRIGVAAIVVNELVPSIEEAVRIRDHGTDDKVRLAAAQWLAGLAGVSPVSKIETAVTDRREAVIEAAPDFATMSVEQLRQYEHSLRKIR